MDLIEKIHTDGFEFVAALMIQQRLPFDVIGRNTDLALLLRERGQKTRDLPEFLNAASRGNANFFPE